MGGRRSGAPQRAGGRPAPERRGRGAAAAAAAAVAPARCAGGRGGRLGELGAALVGDVDHGAGDLEVAEVAAALRRHLALAGDRRVEQWSKPALMRGARRLRRRAWAH
jgi:hypothetical protein